MFFIIENEDIAFACVDVIVNAANGVGFMGGAASAKKLCSGVAEHLNYYTQGKIEKEAKHVLKQNGKILGFAPGEIYITGSYDLNCKCVIHAVTMQIPGISSSYKAVEKCTEEIFRFLQDNGYFSVAIPLLGCGVGGLKADKVQEIIKKNADYYPDIKTSLYVGGKSI